MNALNKIGHVKHVIVESVEDFFSWWASFVFRHAIWFVLIPPIITGLLGIGYFFRSELTSAEELYALPKSEAKADQMKHRGYFGSSEIRPSLVVASGANGENIFNRETLIKLYNMDLFIRNLTVTYEGEVIENGLEKICNRNHLGACNVQSVLNMYGYEPNNFMTRPLAIKDDMIFTPKLDDAFIYDTLISYPQTEKQNIPLPPEVTGTGMTVLTELDVVNGTEAFIFLYNLRGDEADEGMAMAWEESFLNGMKDYSKSANMSSINVSYNAYRSRDEELAASTGQDSIFILLTFCILITYATCLNYSFDLAKSKVYPALGGTLAALLGFVGGIGFCCMCGLHWVTTAMVTPFLCMGIGLDDMFVMVNSYTLAYMVERPKDRCAVCLRDCGLSITMTTITNLLAFAVGSASPYASIRNFCIFTGVSLFFGYIMALSFFFAVLCIDAQRESENRICCRLRRKKKRRTSGKPNSFPPGVHSISGDAARQGSQLSAASVSTFSLVSFKARAVADRNRLRYTKKTGTPAASPTHRMEMGDGSSPAASYDEPPPEGKDAPQAFDDEEFWEEPRGTVGRKWRMFFLYYYGQWVTHPVSKICVLLFFTAFVGVSYNGFTQLPQGLELRQLAPDTSYLQSFEDDMAQFFDKYGAQTMVFFEGEKPWWDSSYRSKLRGLQKKLQDSYYGVKVINPMEIFLSTSYAPISTSPTGNIDQTAYMDGFKKFLSDDHYKRFVNDISWNADETALESFRLTVLPRFYSGSKERGQFMTDMRADVASFPSLSARAYNYFFVFFESDLQILPSVVQNLSIAAACMLFVALILIPKVTSGLLVVLTMAMIDIGLFGFMYYWDLQLNMITMINLVISIGFSVDYSAHICHTFTHCEGETRNLRAIEALVLMGTPVFHGAMSTQMGVVMLSLSSSYIFRVFFRMMTMVLVFGASHGIIFLPVMLSLIGPMPKNKKVDLAAIAAATEEIDEKSKSSPIINETAPPSVCDEDDSTFSPLGTIQGSQDEIGSPSPVNIEPAAARMSSSKLGRSVQDELSTIKNHSDGFKALNTTMKRVSGSTQSMPNESTTGATAIVEEAIRIRVDSVGRKKETT